ncbi:MAG: protealysin inhibitor emfourin [Nocardioides sp.]
MTDSVACQFVPPYLLEKVAAGHPDPEACDCSRGTLQTDARIREQRTVAPPPTASADAPFAVHTAAGSTDLPGALVRGYAAPATGDAAADEAYDGVQAALALFKEVFGRDSFDGRGAAVVATVHYGTSYDNAFWDGHQLVFGDGDGKVFGRFTRPVDVLGHELTHAVTQFTAGLTYSGQSGALNESVSDVFASCLKQRLLGQDAAGADWLIGEGIFEPSVHGKALRSMAEPGTAYDDPVLGKDPQVGSMADYVDTTEDNGGVHLNSGIPNRAFYLAATGIGGNSWEGAGPIWYAALTSGIGASTDFAGFAAATVEAAAQHGDTAVQAVRDAWATVGVEAGASPAGGPTGGAAPADGLVAVTRSGGFAGLRATGAVRLGDADPREQEVTTLVERIDLGAVGPHVPLPDRFVYTFSVRGREAVVGEQDLTPDLARLAELLLD